MAKIRVANHRGDEVIAAFDPANAASVDVAQGKLTAFLEDCVRKHGTKPPVWARRIGTKQFDVFDGDLSQVDDVLLQFPLTGG